MQTLSLRRGTMMPYNAQATLHSSDAIWGLLLPCTVHGRVTDIWRAYFTQRLLWDCGFRIAFSAPWVTQYRCTPQTTQAAPRLTLTSHALRLKPPLVAFPSPLAPDPS